MLLVCGNAFGGWELFYILSFRGNALDFWELFKTLSVIGNALRFLGTILSPLCLLEHFWFSGNYSYAV
jgi:hypothetical protein